MIRFTSRGSWEKTEAYLKKMQKLDIRAILDRHGRAGAAALAAATPRESGLASSSWGYEIRQSGKNVRIVWTNTDVENGFPVAVMLQYGYGTGTGGYVQGQDYINPAIRPIFDKIAADVWKEVTSR